MISRVNILFMFDLLRFNRGFIIHLLKIIQKLGIPIQKYKISTTQPHFANLKHCIKFRKYPSKMDLSANEEVIIYFNLKNLKYLYT